MQLCKQLVSKYASYAAQRQGPHQLAVRRNINNGNNDRGNTFAWDLAVLLCDIGAWEI